MRRNMRSKKHSSFFLISAALTVAVSFYVGQVKASSAVATSEQWPVFARRNLASLAREGYLKGAGDGNKRSISTLAKNGQLPTFRSPYEEAVKEEHGDDSSHEKRDVAAMSHMPGYAAFKRNVQALARDGHRFGRGQYSQQTEKRNIQALARDGYIHKRDILSGGEYYYPFYQNSIPPLSEMEGPMDLNEIYDFQQSVNPDLLPPLSQVYKRSDVDYPQEVMNSKVDYDSNWNLKRGSAGLPAHGLYRPVYVDLNNNVRDRRSIYSIPDVLDRNDIDLPEDYENDNDKRSVDEVVERENFEKRHIGSLARLGLLPSFRFTGGRYSRSGRARLLLPSQEMYRKHSHDENFGIRQYLTDTEAVSSDPDDSDISPPTIPAHTHPTGRYLHRSLNELPNSAIQTTPYKFADSYEKNRWHQTKDVPKFYYFRSLKVPYHSSGKRYLLLPAVDNVMLRKSFSNASLPSRRKNQ